MKVEWSAAALADLDRFAVFLHDRFPSLASVVAHEIVAKTRLLADSPHLGHRVAGRSELRQVVLQVLNAAYVLNIGSMAKGLSFCVSSMVANGAGYSRGPDEMFRGQAVSEVW